MQLQSRTPPKQERDLSTICMGNRSLTFVCVLMWGCVGESYIDMFAYAVSGSQTLSRNTL